MVQAEQFYANVRAVGASDPDQVSMKGMPGDPFQVKKAETAAKKTYTFDDGSVAVFIRHPRTFNLTAIIRKKHGEGLRYVAGYDKNGVALDSESAKVREAEYGG